MNFCEAFQALKEGKKVRRPYMKYFSLQISKVSESHTNAKFKETLVACTEDECITNFTIPNVDILADDWEIVDDIPEVDIHVCKYFRCPSCKNVSPIHEKNINGEYANCWVCDKKVKLKRL